MWTTSNHWFIVLASSTCVFWTSQCDIKIFVALLNVSNIHIKTEYKFHSNITFHGIYMCCIILYKNDVRFAFYSICSRNRYAFLCFVWFKSIADKIVSLCIAITHRAKMHQHSRFVMFVSLPPSLPLSLSSPLYLSPLSPVSLPPPPSRSINADLPSKDKISCTRKRLLGSQILDVKS